MKFILNKRVYFLIRLWDSFLFSEKFDANPINASPVIFNYMWLSIVLYYVICISIFLFHRIRKKTNLKTYLYNKHSYNNLTNNSKQNNFWPTNWDPKKVRRNPAGQLDHSACFWQTISQNRHFFSFGSILPTALSTEKMDNSLWV